MRLKAQEPDMLEGVHTMKRAGYTLGGAALAAILFALCWPTKAAAQGSANGRPDRGLAQSRSIVRLPQTHCKMVVFEGEATEGKSFSRPLGRDLKFELEAVRAGWIVRVLPIKGARPEHDYAELGTPPYNSMTPLALTTDYSFRGQDVVGWNPRHFQFLTDAASAVRAESAYRVYMAHPSQTGAPEVASAMVLLAGLPEKSAQGELQILDARLVPGTADQAAGASLVVAHWASTPHTLDQPADGKPSALGKVEWLRFRATMYLPAGFLAAPGLKPDHSQCER